MTYWDLFPKPAEPSWCETVRVVSRGPQHTVVRLVRTESEPEPEDWTLLTDRISDRMVEGTVARGQLHEDSYLYTGKIGNNPGDYMPFPVTEEVLLRGRERFDIYCSPCHSRLGDGRGMIVQRGFRAPPSYHTERLRNAPLGYFFDVMTQGFGAMPEYASQIPARDRWAIVAYIRALQLSQHATSSDVPTGQTIPSQAPVFRGDPGSGATLPQTMPLDGAKEEAR